MATVSVFVEVQLSSGIWTDLSEDVRSALEIRYGIDGNTPADLVASTGEAQFALENSTKSSGGVEGFYSPLHVNVRVGWTFGVVCQVVLAHGDDVALAVASLTRVGTTATFTTVAAHGYVTNQYVKIAGANQPEYNGTFKITVTGASTATYTISGAPATPATGTITVRAAHVKHRGRVRIIDPDPGQHGRRWVRVISYDGIRELAETDLRSVGLQISKTEAELVTAILDALPASAQPVARDLDTGVDLYPFAFDDLGPGQKALSVIKDVCVSAFASSVMRGDGTFQFINRHERFAGSLFTFTNVMAHDGGLGVPSTMEQVWNLVRVFIHPRTISAVAEEIYVLPTGAFIEIPAGEMREVWTDYNDPNDRQTDVGGTEVVTTLVGGTHYSANSVSDGSGTNLTAAITATITPFASTAKWSLTNTSTATAYIRLLKVVGKALRDPGPQSFEATSVQAYGTRPLEIDLRYQTNAEIARSYATFIENQYNDLIGQLDFIAFHALQSSALLTQALVREPGEVITVTEAVSGVSSSQAVIQQVELSVSPGRRLRCRFGLAPAAPFQAWQLGVAGRSELDQTTVLGF